MTIAADVPSQSRSSAWLGSPEFDFLMTGCLTALSLAFGVLIAAKPEAVGFVLLVDNWFLGFPHVAATFTRLVPDRAAAKAHPFLVFALPPLVIAVTAALAFGVGIWAVGTVYFYWQWFHTARQSWGISKLYASRSGGLVRDNPVFLEALYYVVPLWGLLHRLTTARDHFLFPSLQIAIPVIPVLLADGVGVVACCAMLWWGVNRLRDALAGQLAFQHTLFTLSHFLIFIVGYVLMDDMSGGWVVTNIWHTGQYLMLVWLFNQRSLEGGGVGPGAVFKILTRGNSPWLYVLTCFLVALPIYVSIALFSTIGASAMVLAVVANQTLNFHHFIVDGVIWRSKRIAGTRS